MYKCRHPVTCNLVSQLGNTKQMPIWFIMYVINLIVYSTEVATNLSVPNANNQLTKESNKLASATQLDTSAPPCLQATKQYWCNVMHSAWPALCLCKLSKALELAFGVIQIHVLLLHQLVSVNVILLFFDAKLHTCARGYKTYLSCSNCASYLQLSNRPAFCLNYATQPI